MAGKAAVVPLNRVVIDAAAMEPACKWREKAGGVHDRVLAVAAAMEPACKWREKDVGWGAFTVMLECRNGARL